MKRYCSLILIIAILLFTCSSCGNSSSAEPPQTGNHPPVAEDNTADAESDPVITLNTNPSEMFTKRDKKSDYSDDAVRIRLTGTSATATSDTVQISGNTITITEEDCYILSGTLEDGSIVVNAADSAKIHLVLDGVDINSNNSAAILVVSADKVVITLASGQNRLSNGGSFTTYNDINVNAALFSKDDLSLNGNASLTITSPAGHGISCKDDLVLAGGNYIISSANHGLDANDSIRLTASTVSVEAGKDGFHAENNDDTRLGFIYIADGTYKISAQDDGIHAASSLVILGGDIDIPESYEGIEAFDLAIGAGNIRIIASDDGLNASNGTETVSNDGFGERVNNKAGGVDREIPEDFEKAPDNRMNKPDKSRGGRTDFPDNPENVRPDFNPDTSNNFGNFGGNLGGFGGGFPNLGSGNCNITITGGNLYIQASGDGIDANGSLTVTGGNITICGPNYGDTASLDYDINATLSGATFIATGGAGMAQTISSSEQGVITVNVGNQNAGTTLTLTDSKGNVVLAQTPELPYSLVILSSPDLKSGESYAFTIGTTTKTITAE